MANTDIKKPSTAKAGWKDASKRKNLPPKSKLLEYAKEAFRDVPDSDWEDLPPNTPESTDHPITANADAAQ